jgi:quercetin dioxygenase-like cupin family protein
MIKIEKYTNLEEAFDRNMSRDVGHVLIRHSYKKGTKIQPHMHIDSDEFVICSKGRFKISSEGDKREFELNGKNIVVIHYPAGREHALEVLSEKLDYFVLRAPKK